MDPTGWKKSVVIEIVGWHNPSTEERPYQYWLRGYASNGEMTFESLFTYYSKKEARDHANDLAKRIGDICNVKRTIAFSNRAHARSPDISTLLEKPVRMSYEMQRRMDRKKK